MLSDSELLKPPNYIWSETEVAEIWSTKSTLKRPKLGLKRPKIAKSPSEIKIELKMHGIQKPHKKMQKI